MEPLYKPLSTSDPSEIRFVKIYAGKFDQVPRCELFHAHLSPVEELNTPFYTCLSYTWGDTAKTSNIRMNGIDFAVTLNLYSFLQHMQAILYKLATHLPKIINDNSTVSHLILQRMFCDSQFPRGLQSIDESALDAFVKRHVRRFLNRMNVSDNLDVSMEFMYRNEVMGKPEDLSYVLWIDALCINQRDLDEKSVQVERMTSIYKLAPFMIVWLFNHAEPISRTEDIANAIYELFTTADAFEQSSASKDDNHDRLSSFLLGDSFLAQHKESIKHLGTLLSQKWFTRTWIIQEIAVTKATVVVLMQFWPVLWEQFWKGVRMALTIFDKRVEEAEKARWRTDTYDSLRVGFQFDTMQAQTLLEVVAHEQAMLKRNEQQGVAEQFQLLLQHTRGKFSATDPRDLLYSLLGLLRIDKIPFELQPNYSMKLESVFHRYDAYFIRSTNAFKIGHCSRRALQDVPSWVTDWRYYTDRSSDKSAAWTSSELQHIEISEDASRLTVEGIKVDEVKGAIRGKLCVKGSGVVNLEPLSIEEINIEVLPYRDLGDKEGNAKRFNALKELCLRQLSSACTKSMGTDLQAAWDSFWPSYNHQDFQVDRAILERRVRTGGSLSATSRSFLWRSLVIPTLMHYSLAQGIGFTSGGHMVSCRRRDDPVQVGDSLWVLKGSERLWLLRPVGFSYHLIGDIDTMSLDPGKHMSRGNLQTQKVTIS